MSLSQADLAKVDQMQENLIAYYRLFEGIPGISFMEGEVTWAATEGGRAPGNQVLRTQTSADAVDRVIGETLSQMGQYTDAMDWLVFPGCQPANLGKRLEACGQAGGPDGSWMLVGEIPSPGGTWMLADLNALSEAPPVADNFHIEYVDDDAMLEGWRAASAEGFGGGPYYNFYEAYARHGYGPEAFSLNYIGYLADQPVTSSTLLLAGGIASVYNISTPPALRRQGFGGAITWFMLQEARKRGYQYAWTWASPMGKSVYAKLGFVAADFGVREYQWRKR
jgi:GNAT superfamily N-acetyltransferase